MSIVVQDGAMSSNRDRITVDLEGDSRRIVYIMPAGYKRIGIVRQGNGEVGVLALIENTGQYVQLNERGTRPLHQRKIQAALAAAKRPVGRPKVGYEFREVFSVRLEPALAEYGRELGKGNLSAGVTKALEECRDRNRGDAGRG